jgi:hypothetical protein
MQPRPDTEIRSEVRSLLVQHRVDAWRLQVRVTSGTVRISGELSFLGGSQPQGLLVESIERDLSATQGVKRAFLELSNWKRNAGGEWKAVDQAFQPLATAA